MLGPSRIPDVLPEDPEIEIAVSKVEKDLVASMRLLIEPAFQYVSMPDCEALLFVLEVWPSIVTVPARILKPGLN